MPTPDRIIAGLLAGALAFFPAIGAAQSQLSGFPPAVFQSRGPIDAAAAAVTPVALDARDATGTQYAAATTHSYTGLTVGSGGHRALVCSVGADLNSGLDPVTVVWDSGGTNQSMTPFLAELGNGASSIKIILYGLVAPTSGNKTLSVTFNSAASSYISCISFTNVSQTGGTTTFANAQTIDSSGTSPVALTTTGTAAVDASVAALMCASGNHWSSTTGNAWYGNSSGPGGNSYGNYMINVGLISGTIDSTHECVMAAMTIKAG
jgi:hypothetical protein